MRIRMSRQGLVYIHMQQREYLKLVSLKRSMYAFAGDMIPERPRFPVPQQDQTVVQTACRKMMRLVIDHRGQTDPAIAYRSERNQPRLACNLTLSNMVIGHLLGQNS